MGNCDVDVSDHHPKKAEFPVLSKQSITNPSGSSKWHGDIHRTSPTYLFSVAPSEHFEKSRLVVLQEAALHDSTVLEMGYQMTDCDGSTVISEGDRLEDPHVAQTVRNPLEKGKDLKAPKPISLRDLKVGKVHRGRILSGTLCCKTVKNSAVMNVLEEDGTNDATRLIISNSMHKSLTTAKSQLLYPEGAKVSVQDPYLKRFADGMVGLLVENPSDIVFTFVPKESPPVEKKKVKEMAGKEIDPQHLRNGRQEAYGKEIDPQHLRNGRQEAYGKAIRCVGSCRWGSLIIEQSASDKTHPEDLQKILSKTHVDDNVDSKSSSSGAVGSEESIKTHESTPEVGAKAQTKVFLKTDKGSLKIEELATIVQDELDSPVDFDRRMNSLSVCEEKNSPPTIAENGRQCDKLSQSSDNEPLNDCVRDKIMVPQSPSAKFEPVRLREDTSYEQEINLVEETNIVRNAEVEQEETDQTQETHQEINELTCGDTITDTFEASVNSTEILVDDSLQKNTLTQGNKDCSPQVCETSHGKEMENKKNEILATANEGGQPSPAATLIEMENQHTSSRRTLEINDTDGTTAETHLTPVALRLLGNKHFAQQNWAKAIDLYTQATFKAIQDSVQETKENLSPNREKIVGYGEPQGNVSQKEDQGSEVVMDYSNRAEAWLRLHQYERAWADSERALSFDPNHLKSLFRKGRALLGLGDYQQALAHFEAANARTPFDKDVLAAIKLSRIADHQNRLGIYDLTDYYLRGRFVGEVPNCADYIGPVQIKANIGDKGRGLFLTKSVEAGDLLLVSNPLAFWQLESQKDKSKRYLNVLAKESTTHEGNPRVPAEIQDKLVEILLERAKVSSKNCRRLIALCYGKQGSSNLSAPSMDLFTSGRQVSPPMEHIETAELDDIRLRQIIGHNAIDGNMVSTTLGRRRVFHEENHDNTFNANFYGLWVLPSFINHACIPNVSLAIIGKSIFVYASKEIHVGEELQCSYYNVFQPLPQRRELASRCWAFSCKCARCLLETKLQTSLEMLQSLHTHLQPNPTYVMRYSPFGNRILAKDIAKQLQTLESSHKLGNRELSWLQASFTQLYITSEDIMGTHGNCPLLYTALCAMEIVSPSPSSLEVGLFCRANVERDSNGKKTSKYKAINQQLLRICKCIFGKHRNTVLQSLVEGFPRNMTRKV